MKEKPDLDLFERVFRKNLDSYNNQNILGTLKFDDLNKTANYIFNQLKSFTVKREKNQEVPYASYPSLKCPVPCTYELVTWQTLFGVSCAIFVLCLITISLYSIFLRKQYISLKNRLKNIKYSKVNPDSS